MSKEMLVKLCVLNLFMLCLAACQGPSNHSSQEVHQKSQSLGVDTLVTTAPDACDIDVYIENSGSMYGYVNGKTDFKDDIYEYLSDLNSSDLCKNLNCCYINNEIIRKDGSLYDFMKNLTPSSFRNSGGLGATTDIAKVISDVLENHEGNSVSILISDFIFSPGTQNITTIPDPSITIKSSFARYLKSHPESGIVFYRMNSNFSGKYYDYKDRPTQINQDRPYYMLIIGPKSILHLLTELVPMKSASDHYELFSGEQKVSYAIQPQKCVGKFGKSTMPDTVTEDAKVDKLNPKLFSVAIGVDYSEILLSDEYLASADNYKISNPQYNIRIKKNETGKYTHTIFLDLSGPIISKGEIAVELLRRNCSWADVYNEDDDSQSVSTEGTYGLKYLVNDGIFEAFNTGKSYATIKITIR